jgi:uncharacterized protein (TIRG00374 family)
MRGRLLRWLPWLLGAALLAVVIRLVPVNEVAAALRQLRPGEIVVLLAANFVVLLAITARWALLLRGQGHAVPFAALFGYRLAVFGLSYFTPGPHVGGEPLQLLLVEREHGVPRSVALAAVALDKALEFGVNFTFLLLGIAAVLRWRIVPADAAQQVLGLVAALLAMPVLYVAATSAGRFPAARLAHRLARARPLRPLAGRLSAAAAVVEAGEQQVGAFYRRAPAAFAAALGVTLLSWLALVGEFWLMIHFLGLDLTLPQLVTTLTAARLAILLLLPAGLGALEMSQAMAFGALGLDPSVGIAAGLLIRARDTLLAGFGLWWGGRRLARGRPQ